jgi:hypothetical protein
MLTTIDAVQKYIAPQMATIGASGVYTSATTRPNSCKTSVYTYGMQGGSKLTILVYSTAYCIVSARALSSYAVQERPRVRTSNSAGWAATSSLSRVFASRTTLGHVNHRPRLLGSQGSGRTKSPRPLGGIAGTGRAGGIQLRI